MSIKCATPMLTVPDIESAVKFYRDTLGFTGGNQTDGWAVVERDGVEVMFALPNPHMPVFTGAQFTGSLYFQMDSGVDDLWAALKDKVTVVYALETFDYGMREFGIRDNNGYVLQFGEEAGERKK
jgi:uncharacterized glyoxalase superfamily protein PhnB